MMKIPLITCRLVIGALLAISGSNTAAQKAVKTFNDSLTKTAYVINNGDSVVVKVDSSFIMNKTTFGLYSTYYDRGRSANSSYKGVLSSYENIINKQDSMLAEKEHYYRQLHANFESMAGKTRNFMDSTRQSLQSVSRALDAAQNQLVNTQELLKDVKNMLLTERSKRNKDLWKLGIGGVVIGAVISTLVLSN